MEISALPNRHGAVRLVRLAIGKAVARLKGARRRLPHDERGVSAVEFAIFTPVLVAICLSMVDLGFALHERMAIDHSLRIAAASAMSDPGKSTVQTVLEETAGKNFAVASGDEGEEDDEDDTFGLETNALTVVANRFCACPASRATEVTCTSSCSGSVTPLAFYSLDATKDFSGILLPGFPLAASLQVQVK